MAIPISQIVQIIPAVVGAGGNPLALNAVALDNGALTPVSALKSFDYASWQSGAVSQYYGTGSTQASVADRYFAGFDNSTKKPGTLFFAGYAAADRAAWLRGSSLAGVTLTQIQAVTGSLSVTVDGVVKTYASVNLAAATSFTNAATLLTTGLGLSGGAAVTWDATTSRFVITSGTTGATSTMTQGTGTAAAALGLAAGTLSQGIVADTPASAMDRIKQQSLNWALFFTLFEPNLADKGGFGAWSSANLKRYAYVSWDTDAGYATPNNPAVFGSIVASQKYDGVIVVYNSLLLAAAVCGWAASVDWNAVNGRANLAFRQFSGLTPTVTDATLAAAVLSNNASYFGQYAADGDSNVYNIVYNGQMGGSGFKWADTYINQVFLNSQLRRSFFEGLLSVNFAPYGAQGETLMRAWAADPIAQALNNGTIVAGVTLSASQKAAINQAAGLDISRQLEQQGYYLQILPATAEIRSNRQSPPASFWYTDGGSIQAINLPSIAVL